MNHNIAKKGRNGAFVAPSILIKQGEIEFSDKLNVLAEDFVNQIDNAGIDFLCKYEVDDYIINYKDHILLRKDNRNTEILFGWDGDEIVDKKDWFISYCNMSEGEKWIYREFKMADNYKIQLNIYKRMYNAVMLMASNYEKQIDALPKAINIADEIALVFDDEVLAVMDSLYKDGMLSLDECALINDINNKLSEMGKKHDKSLWTIEALKESNLWGQCREKAKQLLSQLCNLD